MAELNESKMNFAALKRVDPYAKGLLETAAHVALYTFVNSEWEKTDIEGALFVYSRTGEPFHNILIMNRLNMKNLVEPVTQGLDLQLQDPFLLYRTPQGSIFGIWFYDKEECVKIAGVLTKIIKEALESKPENAGRQPLGSSGNVDIFSMLTKAQEEFNSKSPRKTRPDFLGTSHDMNYNLKESDLTPQSVMDFFAKASNGSKFVQDSNVNQVPGMFVNSPRTGPPPGLSRMPSLPIAIPPPQNDVKPLLQRLMSNPVHSVEHIEKQQRAITPQQGDFVGFIKNGSTNPMLSATSNGDTRNSFPFSTNKLSTSANENGPVNIPGIPQTQTQIENSLSFMRISDSPPSVVHSQQFYNSKLAQCSSPLVTDGSSETNLILTESRPLSAPMELKPALMPPVMFTSSSKKDSSLDPITSTAPPVIGNSTPGNTGSALPSCPEPLTKKQLMQAINYLLKNDPEFMNKLHEAYLKSFAELVS